MKHFLLFLRAIMPLAEWGDHEGIVIAALPDGQRYLVAPLSAWAVVKAINAAKPFPTSITPILYKDVPLSSPIPKGVIPKGRWLLADGYGLCQYRDNVRMGRIFLDAIPKREHCDEPNCNECFIHDVFGSHYSLPA